MANSARAHPAKREALDPAIEEALDGYVQIFCEEEKKEYHSDLAPFPKEQVAAKAREQALDHLSSFSNGYIALIEELSKDASSDLCVFAVPEENLAIFEDEEKYSKSLEEGKYLYQLLGFAEETLGKLYEAAYRLQQQQKMEKAKDGFYFLAMIAPRMASIWYSLGYCFEALQHYPQAKDAFEQAIQLDPTQANSYVGAIRTSLACQDRERAELICEKGLELADQYSDQEWSHSLRERLSEESSFIKQSHHHSIGG